MMTMVRERICSMHGGLTTMQEYQAARDNEGKQWEEFVNTGKAALRKDRLTYTLGSGVIFFLGAVLTMLAFVSSIYPEVYIFGGITVILTTICLFLLFTRADPSVFDRMNPEIIGLQEEAADHNSFEEEVWECAVQMIKDIKFIYNVRFDGILNQTNPDSIMFSLDNSFRVQRMLDAQHYEVFDVRFVQRDIPEGASNDYGLDGSNYYDLIDTRTGEPVQPV